MESIVNRTIQQWKDGEIHQPKMLEIFEYERDKPKKFQSYLERLVSAIPD
jgi:hypothetical protein